MNRNALLRMETDLYFRRIPSFVVGASMDASQLQEIQGTNSVHSMRYFSIHLCQPIRIPNLSRTLLSEKVTPNISIN